MPRIEHIALWTQDLGRLREFYVRYFGARAGAAYRNDARDFDSCFLEFDAGARIEIMRSGRVELVDAITLRLAADGHPVLDGPRRTGDGYYESVVLDPDGNRVEVTA
jgi:lactoylglutathione lyase